jgi:hypothetical protein
MNQIIAAHICYLIADKNFDPYSESARLCLVGADHWKCPRTYASPDAIQVNFYHSVLVIIILDVRFYFEAFYEYSPCFSNMLYRNSDEIHGGRHFFSYLFEILLICRLIFAWAENRVI